MSADSQKAWRERNAERIRENGRRYYLRHHEENKAKARHYHQAHREEILLKMKARGPAHRRAQTLKKYGLTQESWDALFESQGRVCACCGVSDPGTPWGWATDHVHGTEGPNCVVRGILCVGCNVAMGFVTSDPDHLRKLVAYAERWATEASRATD